MNDELIVSNDKKATPIYLYLWRTKSKLLKPMQIDVLTAHLIKSLFPPLGASKWSRENKILVESLSSANASLERSLQLVEDVLLEPFTEHNALCKVTKLLEGLC